MVIYFLKLIRWPNLIMIALIQLLVKIFIIKGLAVPHMLSNFEYFLGILCTTLLAAAGYLINDYYDEANDAINKPERMIIGKHIAKKDALSYYIFMSFLALLIGTYLAYIVDWLSLAFIPLLATIVLYLYAYDFKRRLLIGNILVSLMTALPIWLIAVFDILPGLELYADRAELMASVFKMIGVYGLFAAIMNFIREIAKDAEDLEGDKAMGFQTLAILFGRKNSGYVLSVLMLIVVSALSRYLISLVEGQDILSASYLGIFVILPLIFLMIKSIQAESKLDFKKISTGLKRVMLFGILSIIVFTISFYLAVFEF